MKKVTCPYCGSEAELVDSKIIYGRSYGMIYLCSNYPACEALVGAHKQSLKPLGRLANAELRSLRKKAHRFFDPLWKSGRMPREKAYAWLGKQMGIPKKLTHIAYFDEEQCRKVISICMDHRNCLL